MATELPEGFFERVAEFRHYMTVGMQGGLSAIQELDLTLTQAMAVFQLSERGPMGVTELQVAVGRSQAATSHLVEQLEQRGLVRRRPDAADRRRRVVALTARGRTAVGKVEAMRRQTMASVLEPIPREILERFDAALLEILEVLRAEVPPDPR